MLQEISRMLSNSGYMPHGYCINWSQPLVLTFVISDVLIFLAYCSMPIALGYFAHRRKDFPYPGLLVMFAAFIVACGFTHLMGAVVLWKPWYELDAALKVITAIVSVVTAVVLWPMIPKALSLPSPSQLQQLNQALQAEIERRMQIEEALKRAKETAEQGWLNERLLRSAIVECSEDAIIGIALDGTITSWNQAAERMFEYSAADVLGKSLFLLIPQDQQATEAAILQAISRGEVIQHYETERLHHDGRLLTVSIAMSPIRDNAGQVVGASKIVRDMSERKQAEQEIQRLNADLEQRVIERTAELSAANRELDSFAYAVSHDLRAPLRAINGFSQALLEDYGQSIPHEGQAYLEQMGIAANKMAELIDGLLVLSRSTRGDMRHDVIDLSALAQQLLAELSRRDPQRQVSVDVEMGMQARGDGRMIEAMLRNLLENAWKYTAQREAGAIRVYSEMRGSVRYFCVADNGAGFDMEYANRLFQPFQRLHRQDEFPGIGIGLATVQRIVHRHGGCIEAYSQPGKGATFRFSLAEQAATAANNKQETL